MVKKKTSKKSYSTNRVVILGVIAVITIFLIYGLLMKSHNPSALRVDLTAEETLPNSGWKTFTNKDYQFTFKYPPQFTVQEKKEIFESRGFSGEKVSITRFMYLLSTGNIVNGQPDWSGFSISVEPALGKTLTESINGNGPEGAIGVTLFPAKNGADESGTTVNIENVARAYRKGNSIFTVGTLQNANTSNYPNASDFFGTYQKGIFDSIEFN